MSGSVSEQHPEGQQVSPSPSEYFRGNGIYAPLPPWLDFSTHPGFWTLQSKDANDVGGTLTLQQSDDGDTVNDSQTLGWRLPQYMIPITHNYARAQEVGGGINRSGPSAWNPWGLNHNVPPPPTITVQGTTSSVEHPVQRTSGPRWLPGHPAVRQRRNPELNQLHPLAANTRPAAGIRVLVSRT